MRKLQERETVSFRVGFHDRCHLQRDIARGEVHSRNGYDKPDDTEEERNGDVPEPLANLVRVSCDDEGHNSGEAPWRGAQKKRNSAIVSERRSERGEVRVEGERDDHASESKREPPDFPVCDSHHQAMHASASLGLALVANATILRHTKFSEFDLQR